MIICMNSVELKKMYKNIGFIQLNLNFMKNNSFFVKLPRKIES